MPLPPLSPPERTATVAILDILLDQTRHLGKHASSPARRIASGHVETQLTEWKDEIETTATENPA